MTEDDKIQRTIGPVAKLIEGKKVVNRRWIMRELGIDSDNLVARVLAKLDYSKIGGRASRLYRKNKRS